MDSWIKILSLGIGVGVILYQVIRRYGETPLQTGPSRNSTRQQKRRCLNCNHEMEDFPLPCKHHICVDCCRINLSCPRCRFINIHRANIPNRSSDRNPFHPGQKAKREGSVERALQCTICCDEPVNRVFVPCGHTACSQCATKIDKRCPQCRTGIRIVQPLFLNGNQ